MLLTCLLNGFDYETDSNLSEIEITSVCSDSRKATHRSLFVAISGAVWDGHDFVKSAYEQGCRCFLTEKDISPLPADSIIIRVKNTRIALACVSAEFYGRPAEKLKIIGITGTKGKTTSSLFLYHIFNESKIPTAYIGSNGIYYGGYKYETTNTTPESNILHYHFSRMAALGIKNVVMEISSQGLWQKRVYGIKFDACAFTNLYTDDHIGGAEHPTFEHYRDCKRTLFFDYGCRQAVYNADDPSYSYFLPDGISFKTYGIKTNADFMAENVSLLAQNGVLGTSFKYSIYGETVGGKLRIPGTVNVYNALCAMSLASFYGIGGVSSARILSECDIRGRGECVPVFDDRYFVIDYAHNGASMRAMLTSLRSYSPKRLVCLFGSVGGRTQIRRPELGNAAADLADFCILTSDNPDFEKPEKIIEDIERSFAGKKCKYISVPDRAEALKYAFDNSKKGDIILLAGKGHEEYQLIEGRKTPFSERQILFGFLPDKAEAEFASELSSPPAL